MKKTRRAAGVSFILSVLLAVSVAGCRSDKADEPVEHVDTGVAEMVLTLDPDPPIALKKVTFTAEVWDSEGAPLSGAEVVFDLSMPGMYHGENRPVAGEIAPGVYRAEGILTMSGKWLVSVEVKAKGLDVVKKFYTVAEGG